MKLCYYKDKEFREIKDDFDSKTLTQCTCGGAIKKQEVKHTSDFPKELSHQF